jgi:hypothetical protein
LNTNEDFRNLILYGIEDKNYVWTEAIGDDGNPIIDEAGKPYKVIRRLDDNAELAYVLDVNKTGNVIAAYPSEDENPLSREYALEQNNDMQIEYTIGFNLYKATFANGKSVDLTAIKAVSAASKAIKDKISAASTAEELEAVLAEIETLVAGADVQNVLDMPGNEETPEETPEGDGAGEETPEEKPEEEKKEYTSVAYFYDQWLVKKALKVAEPTV